MSSVQGKSLSQNMFFRIIKRIWTDYSIVVVCVCLFAIFGFIQPRFFTVSNMLLITRQASIVGMIALGMTFIIITGGIDLSSGHVLAAAGAVLIYIQGREYLPMSTAITLSILACIVTATLLGFLNGVIITKFRLPAFIITLAIGIIARSMTMYFLQGQTLRGRPVLEFRNIGMGMLIGNIPNALVIWIVSIIILCFVLYYTKFGSYIYAVGGNENAARYSGIKVNKIKIMAYTLAGLCVSIATVLDLSRMAAISPSTSGEMYEFDAITAVVVGGTALSGGRGKILGTVFGVIMIAAVSNIMVMMQISPYLAGTVKGLIILAAVLLQRRDKTV